MSDGADHACALLKRLLAEANSGTQKRSSSEFLPFIGEWTEEAEWGRDWHFSVGSYAADALDIVYTTFSKVRILRDEHNRPIPLLDASGQPIIKNGKKQYKKGTFYTAKWTQGVTFRFHEGMVFYDTIIPIGENWIKSLQRINKALQIAEASPVEPAKGEKKRTPGRVRYHRYIPNSARTRLEMVEECVTTQDAFVYFLITGQKQA